MSEPIPSPPTGNVPPGGEGEMLQFDQAEFATPAPEHPSCFVCHQPILEEYYEISQRVMCPRCRQGVEASFQGGSAVARFLKAAVFGIAGAAVGVAIYYAFVRATDQHWAVISIVAGILVGKAVRKGTGNRGGLVYQLLAVFLTYSSIVAMHIGLLLGLLPAPGGGPQPVENVDRGKAAKPPAAVAEGKQAAAPGAEGGDADAQDKEAGPQDLGSNLFAMLRLLVILIGVCYAIPVMVATGYPIAGLIYGFALWEAWKLNRPVQLVFNGPFRLAPSGVADAGSEEIVDES